MSRALVMLIPGRIAMRAVEALLISTRSLLSPGLLLFTPSLTPCATALTPLTAFAAATFVLAESCFAPSGFVG